VEVRSETLQVYLANAKKSFDLIILSNSINHLNEEACSSLHFCQDSRLYYKDIFDQLYKLMRIGGSMLITDCSRTNFFDRCGLVNPFMPTIEWSKHQSPTLWCSLLKESKFVIYRLDWSTWNSLGAIGRILFGNKFAAFISLSHFKILCAKVK
jgi:hypothetical protein